MAKTTTDHQVTRRRVEDRGSRPADEALDAQGLAAKGGPRWGRFSKVVRSVSAARRAERGRRGKAPPSRKVGRERRRESSAIADAIDLLETQHRAAEGLFDYLVGGDGTDRREVFVQLADLLAVHATIEERHFYAAVKASATDELVEDSLQDHLLVKCILADMLGRGEADPDFDQKLEELEGLVESHVIEEETELFPKVREILDESTLDDMAQEMLATMLDLEQEGAPRERVIAEVGSLSPAG